MTIKSTKPSITVLCAAIASAFALSACGGGGGSGSGSESSNPGSGSGYAPVNVSIKAPAAGPNSAGASSEVLVSGLANTPNTKLANLAWTVQPSGATLTNADCATAVKNSVTYTENQQNATGNSNWSCAVGIAAPITLAKATTYTLTLTATDEKGNTKTASQAIAFNPATGSGDSGTLSTSAGSNFTALPGSVNPLHCAATGGVAPYTYQWSIGANGGYNVALSSYILGDTSFTAPGGAAALSFTCRATDASGSVGVSRVNATILSPAASTLRADAGNNFTAQGNATVPLHCSATGGTAPYTYAWRVAENSGHNVVLASYAAADTSFVAPAAGGILGFTCTAKDATGASFDSRVDATVSPVPSNLVTFAGNNFTSPAGVTNPLHCSATGGTAPYTYQWVISDNAGFNVNLASYALADTSFTTPAGEGVLGFTCRATDANGNIASSRVNATVSQAAPGGTSFVANIAQLAPAQPNSTLTLDGSATGWFDPQGKPTTGTAATYLWTTDAQDVVISNPGNATTTAKFQASNLGPRTVSFTLKATSGTQTSSAIANVLVDPYGPFSLTFEKPATAALPNEDFTITAVGKTSAQSPQLYYQWTQVGGPSVLFGGATTSTIGFVPKISDVGAEMVFHVVMGYQPITAAYPGVYSGDVVVAVIPPKN